MIYITNLVKITDSKYYPITIHYQPFDIKYGVKKTKEEMESSGYLLDKTYEDLLNEETQFKNNNPAPSNSVIVRYFNPLIMEFFYEYEEIPPEPISPEEEIVQLKTRIKDLEDLMLMNEGVI
jgi:hypothetical protein